MARDARRVVLDTSCVRGTPRNAIDRLIDRGFEVHVSGLAVHELAVHLSAAMDSASSDGLRARMAYVSALSGGLPRFAPTHLPLVSKLGGKPLGIPEVPYAQWLRDVEQGWVQLTSGAPGTPELLALVERMASYVGETGKRFVDTMQAAAAFGELSPEELQVADKVWELLPDILDLVRLPEPPSKRDRFDAYSRMQALHARRAYAQAIGQHRACEENDAIDLNLLQHLADGALLATRDYRFIENVDASGTQQAPWVRTVGELVAGRMPAGPPFGRWARRQRTKHRHRTRGELAATDRGSW